MENNLAVPTPFEKLQGSINNLKYWEEIHRYEPLTNDIHRVINDFNAYWGKVKETGITMFTTCPDCGYPNNGPDFTTPKPSTPQAGEEDHGICKRCEKRDAVKDYNGQQYWVCEPCYEMLSDEFDEEYK